MSVALRIHELSKCYSNNKLALDSASLTVPEGSFFALLGPNGAGKSTMINIMADTVIPTSGSIQLFGHEMFDERLWCKRQMGVVPQEVAFDPFFTPREILKMICGLYGQKPDMKWIEDLLDRLELVQHADEAMYQVKRSTRNAVTSA